MRLGTPAVLSILCLAPAALATLAQAGGGTLPAAKKPAKTRSAPKPGGAAPPRNKPAQVTSKTTQVPATRPSLPVHPSRFPANVLAPGRNPELPGLPGLQARPFNPLLFGVTLSPATTAPLGGQDKLSALLKGAGVTSVRITLRWPDIERVKGKFDWQKTDRLVRYLARQGLPIVATVDGSPLWTGQPGLPTSAIVAELERLAFSAASRYKGAVNLWELWNEPDSGPAFPDSGGWSMVPTKSASYSGFLITFYRAVKRANPAAKVAVGGLAVRNTQFLADLYHMGVRASFDAVALHPSAQRDIVDLAWIDAVHNLMLQRGDASKPIWITDWGWSTAIGRPDAVTELHQARLIRQSLAGMRDRPYIALADYRSLADWRERESDPSSLVVTGLASCTLQPKPGYIAFREMATGFNPEAIARYARVPLVGALPLAEEAGVRGSAIQVLVDAAKPSGRLPRLWEGFAQGYEPAITTLPGEIAAPLKTLGVRVVRFDPFPNPDWVQADGIVAVEQNGHAARAGNQAMNIRWQYADSMMDSLESAGATAMFNFATMPSALSSPTGNPRMPRDLDAWGAYVRQVVRRYSATGRTAGSYWELSNEPDRGDFTVDEWIGLYEAFARAVVAEDPKARVGGPSTAGYDEGWLRAVAERCERNRIPLHFLSWHAYGQSSAELLRQVESARAWLRPLKMVGAAQIVVSEWNPGSRPSPENDSLIGAARTASSVEGILNAGPDQALYYELREGPDPRKLAERLIGRVGLLTHDNRPKAAYNLFRLLEKLEPERIPASSEETDIHAIASRSANRVAILLWSDPSLGTETERLDLPVYVRVRGLPWQSATEGEQWTIDPQHGDLSTRPDRTALETAGRFTTAAGDIEIPVILSPHSITLLTLRQAKGTILDLALEAPRYVVYGYSRVPLTARVRNPSAQARQVTLSLGGRDMARGKGERVSLTVGPNETKTIPFNAAVENGPTEGQQFFTLTAGPSKQGGESASASVKLAPPVVARLEINRIDLPPASPNRAPLRHARFKLILENRSDLAASVGVVGGSTSVSAVVPTHQTVTVPVVAPVPKDLGEVFTVPIRITQGMMVIDTLHATVSPMASSHYAARVPRINADLSEWAEADKLPLRPAIRDHRGSISSLSGQAMMLWDDHALYLAISLADSDDAGGTGSAEMAAGPPEVQITAIPAGSQTAVSPIFNVDLDRTGARLYRANPAGDGRPPSEVVPSARVAARREGRRTVYEIALPWTELGGPSPKPGQRLAFALRINDIGGRGGPGLEYAGALIGDSPARLPIMRLDKP